MTHSANRKSLAPGRASTTSLATASFWTIDGRPYARQLPGTRDVAGRSGRPQVLDQRRRACDSRRCRDLRLRVPSAARSLGHGTQPKGLMGLLHHQLRLLHRDQLRRRDDQRHPPPHQREVARGAPAYRRGDPRRRPTGQWPAPLTRIAEATAVAALLVGAIYPIIDLGRPDRFLYVIQYAQVGSPIVWDLVAISTYMLASLVFLYLPLIPDLATTRDTMQPSLLRRI